MRSKPRLLLVDDAATARFALAALLGSRFEVHVAADGRSGLAVARTIRPDLILLDVVMPVMDGLSACRALRAEPATAATPIILVTSQSEEWDLEAGYASGCTDYVLKPADPAELFAKVDTWLAASRPDSAA